MPDEEDFQRGFQDEVATSPSASSRLTECVPFPVPSWASFPSRYCSGCSEASQEDDSKLQECSCGCSARLRRLKAQHGLPRRPSSGGFSQRNQSSIFAHLWAHGSTRKLSRSLTFRVEPCAGAPATRGAQPVFHLQPSVGTWLTFKLLGQCSKRSCISDGSQSDAAWVPSEIQDRQEAGHRPGGRLARWKDNALAIGAVAYFARVSSGS